MNALGKHLLLELKDCNEEVLNDLDFLRSTLVTTASDCGATVLGESFHPFNPHGVSGVVVNLTYPFIPGQNMAMLL